MSSGSAVLASMIGWLAWATPLAAQEAELLERIEVLQSELDVAARALADADERAAAEAAAARRAIATTFPVGPFRVTSLPDQAEVAAELFESVWREDFGGVTGSPSLERTVFTFEWWRTRSSELHLATTGIEDGIVRRVEVARLWVPTRQGLRALVRDAMWSALREDFPEGSSVRGWLGDAPYLRHEDAYRVLAVMGTGTSRSCLAGDLPACSAMLWLTPVEAVRLSEWFTPRQRRTMVNRAIQPWNARADARDADVVACIERDDIGSCDAVLARIAWTEAVPTASVVLVSAFQYAVRVGGEGAWRRAIQDPSATPADVLEHVAGVPVDELVADWRAFLLGRRPAVHADLGRSAATATLWILIFAGFAMRSTRWRFA